MVKKAVEKSAFDFLTGETIKHSKVAHIPHNDLKLHDYFKSGEISEDEAKVIFQLRTRD